jgi:hypothetical protein
MNIILGLAGLIIASVSIFIGMQVIMFGGGNFSTLGVRAAEGTALTIAFYIVFVMIVKKWINFLYWPLFIIISILTASYFIVYPFCIIYEQCSLPESEAITLIFDYASMIVLIVTYHLLQGEKRLEYIFLLIAAPFSIETRLFLDSASASASAITMAKKCILAAIYIIINALLLVTLDLIGMQAVDSVTSVVNNIPYFIMVILLALTIAVIITRYCVTISKLTNINNYQKYICYGLLLFLGNVNGGALLLAAMCLDFHLHLVHLVH